MFHSPHKSHRVWWMTQTLWPVIWQTLMMIVWSYWCYWTLVSVSVRMYVLVYLAACAGPVSWWSCYITGTLGSVILSIKSLYDEGQQFLPQMIQQVLSKEESFGPENSNSFFEPPGEFWDSIQNWSMHFWYINNITFIFLSSLNMHWWKELASNLSMHWKLLLL